MDRSRAAACLHAAVLLVAVPALLWVNRHQWFVADEWDFLVDRRADSLDSLLQPHNEHWSTLPILVYRALIATVGLRSYLPYVTIALLTHLVAAHLLWRIMRRTGTDPWIAAGLAAVFTVLGAGHDNLLWAFQLGFNAALALGLLAIILVADDRGRRHVAAAVTAVVSLLTSGVAVVMVGVAGLAAALRGRVRTAALVVTPAAVVYVVWLAGYGQQGLGSHAHIAQRSIGGVARYVWVGMAGTAEEVTGLHGWGGLVLLVTAVLAAYTARRRAASWAVPVAMVVGVMTLFALIGVGRTGAGLSLARSPRYVHVATGLLLPLAGLALTGPAAGSSTRRVVVMVLLAALTWRNWSLLVDAARITGEDEQHLKAHILAAAELVESGAPLVSAQVASGLPNLQVPELGALAARGALPEPDRLSRVARLEAAAHLQMDLTETPVHPPARPPSVEVTGVSFGTVPPVRGGCMTFAAGHHTQIALTFPGPATVRLRTSHPGDLVAYLADADGHGVRRPRVWPFPEDTPHFLTVTRPDSTVFLEVPAADRVQVCGVAP